MRLFACVAVAVALLCQAPVGAAAQHRVALTFDDGPDEHLTPRLLDILKSEGVKATFCLVGLRVVLYPNIVRRIYEDGHELCNHSWSHPLLTRGNVEQQIAKADRAIRVATGTAPAILRAPYGSTGSVGSCYDGRPFVGWGHWDGRKFVGGDTQDWLYRKVGRITRVALAAHADEIVLMHDIHRATVAAVPGIITGLKARGVSFVRASELWRSGCFMQKAGR